MGLPWPQDPWSSRRLTYLPLKMTSQAVSRQGGLLPSISINYARNQLWKTGQEPGEAISVIPKADFGVFKVTCRLASGDCMASLLLALEPWGSSAQVDFLDREKSRV